MANKEKDLLKIGEFAERGGVSRRSLRHYEDLGLLTPTSRSSGGFRLYSETDLFKLEVIKIFKELGFSLEDIRDVLQEVQENVGEGKQEQINFSQDVLKRQLTEVNEQLEELKKRRELIKQGMDALEECRDCSQKCCPDHCTNRRYFL